jgi:thioredoxin reductase (NADPH)
MSEPILLVVDDDPGVLQALEHALIRRYSADYCIVVEGSADNARLRLSQAREQGDDVALVMANHWMPGMTGIEYLIEAHDLYPAAKRCLLIDFGDTTTAVPIMQALALRQIDGYLPKPWGNPEERLYPMISEFLGEWARAMRPRFEWLRIVGEQWSPRSHELRDMLERNNIPYGFYEVNSAQGQQLLRANHYEEREQHTPVVILYDGQVLVNPSNVEMAQALKAETRPQSGTFDVTIVGAGPAGLAAAVYGASEGLRTVVIEREAYGGQAGTSSLIRNYLGFPRGISGADLSIRAYEQAWLFGAEFVHMREVAGLSVRGSDRVITLSDGTEVISRTVVLASGIAYNRLNVPALEAFSGSSVFYGAGLSEARAMAGHEVYVVGAGNSAGQAALHLAKYASWVTMLVRGRSLAESMSDYLIRELEAAGNIRVRVNTEIVDANGKHRLEQLVLRDNDTSRSEPVPATALFILIGAAPHTHWLAASIERDETGYILTGADLLRESKTGSKWPLKRPPLLLETSIPGVFAAGDVRHRSVKRVASAVGEGAIAIQLIHQYLAELHAADHDLNVET